MAFTGDFCVQCLPSPLCAAATFWSAVVRMGALKGVEVSKGELSNEILVTLAELWKQGKNIVIQSHDRRFAELTAYSSLLR